MKISFILVSILTALTIFLPYFYLIAIGERKNKRKKDFFNNILKSENFIPEFKEQWNQNFIAIDKSRSAIIFIKLNDNDHSVNKINIYNLKTCIVNKTTRNINFGSHKNVELKTLDLVLSFRTIEDECILNFFDAGEKQFQNFEMERAEKWKNLIEQSRPKPIFHKKAA